MDNEKLVEASSTGGPPPPTPGAGRIKKKEKVWRMPINNPAQNTPSIQPTGVQLPGPNGGLCCLTTQRSMQILHRQSTTHELTISLSQRASEVVSERGPITKLVRGFRNRRKRIEIMTLGSAKSCCYRRSR